MTIQKLNNPLTDTYRKFKSVVFGEDFPWFWFPSTTYNPQDGKYRGHEDHGYYTHTLLNKPGIDDIFFAKQNSQVLPLANNVAAEILSFNNIIPKVFYRLSVNCEHPTDSGWPDLPHYDHEFPHHNMLIYLTSCNKGYTSVQGKKYFGEEDDVILFNGEHFNAPPRKDRRIVMVTTFMF